MLKLTELTRVFHDPKRGEFAAVNGVSFEAKAGEVFGLLGPNGAGKTTTLRMVASILRPTSGSITLDEQSLIDATDSIRSKIGFLSASTGLYERLTPREILTYFARLCGYPVKRISERVEEVITCFKMSDYAETRCEKLSTGMLQRVSIARAVVHDPKLLILDEPTSGLDVIAKQSMYEFVLRCKSENKVIVFSTHLMNEAEKLCDRVGILYKGTLFADGTIEELRLSTGQHYLEDIFLSIVKEDMIETI